MSTYQVVVFANPENPSKVRIMYPTGIFSLEELIQQQINTAMPYKVMSPTDLPAIDNDYYDAWELISSAEDASTYDIQVNLERAKDIHRNLLREQRKPILETLDVAFMRAVERGDTVKQQEVAAKKQVLRDITIHPAIAAATNTAELRALTLDVLTTMS